ncbi:MAG TPA: hypothetical protein VK044_00225 [Virgibacillus sp.]|nr:hypothetical protein [Virgibacillus sp.]
MSPINILIVVISLIIFSLVGFSIRGWGGAVIGLFTWLFIAGLIDLKK